MTTTRIVDLKGAREALPMRNVRCPHQKINPEQLCYVCKGENDVVNEIQSVNLEVDLEAMVKELNKAELARDYLLTEIEIRIMAEHLATTVKNWARLVRK